MDSRHFMLAGALLSSLAAAQEPGSKQGVTCAPVLDLTFGVYTTDRPTVLYRQFLPVLEALQDAMAAELRQPVDIQLRIFRDYDSARVALVEDEIDFVRFGPSSYILARRENPCVKLLAMEHVDGQKTFKGMIVVRKESPIRSAEDLRGRRFAFGDENSTIGRYFAQEMLVGAGIHAGDLARYEYLGRHDKVFKAVEKGDFDAGSLKSGTFEQLNTENQLRVLVEFDVVTKPWVARAGLDRRVTEAITASLMKIRDPQVLAALGVSGFTTATDDDYAPIRQSMVESERFDAKPEQQPDPRPGR